MTITIAQARSAIAAKIASIIGFKEAKFPIDFFGRNQATIAHKSFAVGISQALAMPSRQRISVGIYIRNRIKIKFAYRLRPLDSYPTDYDLSFDALESVINTVSGDYSGIRQGLVTKYDDSTYFIPDSLEWIIHDINLTVFQTI
tara:strand:+ start:3956 stop:4387 length:432 start_codon:yes stop_codon:yes gene_type:complete